MLCNKFYTFNAFYSCKEATKYPTGNLELISC